MFSASQDDDDELIGTNFPAHPQQFAAVSNLLRLLVLPGIFHGILASDHGATSALVMQVRALCFPVLFTT